MKPCFMQLRKLLKDCKKFFYEIGLPLNVSSSSYENTKVDWIDTIWGEMLLLSVVTGRGAGNVR